MLVKDLRRRWFTSGAKKYCCNVHLRKNGNLGYFNFFLIVDWVCYRFVTVKKVGCGEVYIDLESVRKVLGNVKGKTETGSGVRSNQV